MHVYSITFFLFFAILLSCGNAKQNNNNNLAVQDSKQTKTRPLIDSTQNTLSTRFAPPPEYHIVQDSGTFASYLQTLPLKKAGANVTYYNGEKKYNNQVYAAVVDLPIGKKNLHQCADAVMRLKAEYHWKKKEYDKIHFNYTNGFRVDYSKWRLGYRVKVKGNACTWVKTASPSDSYTTYWKYMEAIFNYAGTMSLSKELKSTPRDSMQIGDVFIQGGFPGHAIIVVQMATNKSGKKVFMLAQSYMPAQELQILYNPKKPESPWYDLDFGNTLNTPEWTFASSDLKRFED